MNTLNRVVLVILLLLAMALCSLALVVPLPTLNGIERQAGILSDLVGRIRLIVRLPVGILLAGMADLLGVLLIILEVRRPPTKAISVEQASGGQVTLSIASIAGQLKAEVNELPDVLQAKPKVSAKRGGVVVELDAKIAGESGVADKAERVVATVRRVVEEKMGLKLARPPKVNIEAIRRSPAERASEEASSGRRRDPDSSVVTDLETSLS